MLFIYEAKCPRGQPFVGLNVTGEMSAGRNVTAQSVKYLRADCGVLRLRRGGVRLTRRKIETDSASSPCGLSTVKVALFYIYKNFFRDSFYCTYSTSSLKQKLQ